MKVGQESALGGGHGAHLDVGGQDPGVARRSQAVLEGGVGGDEGRHHGQASGLATEADHAAQVLCRAADHATAEPVPVVRAVVDEDEGRLLARQAVRQAAQAAHAVGAGNALVLDPSAAEACRQQALQLVAVPATAARAVALA